MGAWIKMISDGDADAQLEDALRVARTPHGTVDNVMRVHSLRPNTMHGHVALYRAALHDDANTLPVWLQEVIGSYVSHLNGCAYSWANHWKNACDLMGNAQKAAAILSAMDSNEWDGVFDGRELALMHYARKLTLNPRDMIEDDVLQLRNHGVDDGQILEANQIIGYFNYANRQLNGLGVTTDGDIVGYYKSDDE